MNVIWNDKGILDLFVTCVVREDILSVYSGYIIHVLQSVTLQ